MSDAILRAKIALENELIRKLSRTLRPYVSALVGGQVGVITRIGWQRVFEGMLAVHYARTVMVMTGRKPPKAPTLAEAALSILHRESLERRARTQADLMMRGIDRQWDEVRRKPEAKSWLSDRISATAARVSSWGQQARDLWDRLRSRFRAVAVAETNGPAEQARLEQARQMAGNRRLVKRWSTVKDNRVRDTHAAAEGQERLINEAFEVGGARMMFPGDQQFGAPIREWINCRCSAIYFAQNTDGSEATVGWSERRNINP